MANRAGGPRGAGRGGGGQTTSVADVAVAVADQVEDVEGQSEEARAEQVAQRRQIRNGRVVRIDALAPHPQHGDVADVQQQHHLREDFQTVDWLPMPSPGPFALARTT